MQRYSDRVRKYRHSDTNDFQSNGNNRTRIKKPHAKRLIYFASTSWSTNRRNSPCYGLALSRVQRMAEKWLVDLSLSIPRVFPCTNFAEFVNLFPNAGIWTV